MKKINNEIYSTEVFANYEFRVKVRFIVSEDWRDDRSIDIYTTETDKDRFNEVIDGMRNKEKSLSFKIENWSSKAQDDRATEFIKDTLNNI